MRIGRRERESVAAERLSSSLAAAWDVSGRHVSGCRTVSNERALIQRLPVALSARVLKVAHWGIGSGASTPVEL